MLYKIGNMLLDPITTCFNTLDLQNNFVQVMLLLLVVVGVCSWTKRLFTY